jgi:hypothetical protein
MNKTLLISVLIFLGGFTLNTQAQTWLWAKSAGGASADEGVGIATDSAGYIYTTGYFESPTITFGTNTLTNTGGASAFIVKYDPAGNVIWARNSIGSSYDFGNRITTDVAGNIYVAGFCQSPTITFGSVTLTNNSSPFDAAYIVKFDSAGNAIWGRSYYGNSTNYGYDVTVDRFNKVYFTGYYVSTSIIFGSDTLTNTSTCNDSVNIFLVKYDSSGNVIWAKTGQGCSQSFCVVADKADNLYITGFFENSSFTIGNITLTNTGLINAFLAKFDSAGNVIWAQSPPSGLSSNGQSITRDAACNLYVTGTFASPTITFGNTVLTNVGNRNMFIAKYDSAGNALWAKSAHGPGDDGGYSLVTDTSANVYVSGTFKSDTITFGNHTLINASYNSNNANSDVFVTGYDSSGNNLWALRAGGTNDDFGYCITRDDSGHIYHTGSFVSSTFDIGAFEIGNYGSYDYFVAKIGDITTDVSFENNQDANVIVYPNPNNGNFALYNHPENSKLIIKDIVGREVYSRSLSSTYINASFLSNGIYFWEINDSKGISSKGKLIISK